MPKLSERIGTTLQAVGGVYDVAAGLVAQITGAVQKALYDANSILVADTDDTPTALVVAASRILGRKASGGIAALTGAEVGAIIDAIAAFAFSSNAATLDLATAKNFAASNTLTGNSTITLTNGADGMNGIILVKQDATGGRTLSFTVAGRTVLKDLNVPDTNPLPTANSITEYHYVFCTVAGTAYVRLFKVFLQ